MSNISRLELPEWGYTPEEIEQYMVQVLCGCVEGPVSVVMLRKNGKDTGKVVILPGQGDLVDAVNKLWPVTGRLVGVIPGRLESVRDVLSSWRYKVKFTGYGVENVYRWEPWMDGMVI